MAERRWPRHWTRSQFGGGGNLHRVVVVGVGSRLAMFVLRLTSPDNAHGVVNDDGFVIGQVTLSGTYNLLNLGAAVGVIGAVRPPTGRSVADRAILVSSMHDRCGRSRCSRFATPPLRRCRLHGVETNLARHRSVPRAARSVRRRNRRIGRPGCTTDRVVGARPTPLDHADSAPTAVPTGRRACRAHRCCRHRLRRCPQDCTRAAPPQLDRLRARRTRRVVVNRRRWFDRSCLRCTRHHVKFQQRELGMGHRSWTLASTPTRRSGSTAPIPRPKD